jgi:hypothetical protein
VKNNVIIVDKELNERYDGNALKLYEVIIDDHSKLAIAVRDVLENGCFCPSCILHYLSPNDVIYP